MNAENIFKPTRLGRLLLNDLFANGRGLLIAIGAALGTLLVVNVSSVGSFEAWRFHTIFFPLTLLIGGQIVTSLSFRELHNGGRGYMYLTLPASMLEKYATKLLLTTVGWTIAALLGYWLFSVIAAGLTSLLFGMSHRIFDPFDKTVWWFVRLYLATQGVAFFGAVYFRKLHLLKTVLTLTAFGIAVSILAGVMARLVFFDYFRGTGAAFFELNLGEHFGNSDSLARFYEGVLKVVEFGFWWVLTPFFWVLGYLRLRDTEI